MYVCMYVCFSIYIGKYVSMYVCMHVLTYVCMYVCMYVLYIYMYLRSVSSHVFTSIVHAFVCSRIDYCNSRLVGLPKVRLSPIQSVLNAAARLVGRLPLTSHISAFIFDHLHWLPLIARIQLKVLTLVYRSHICWFTVPRYLRYLIRLPSSAISLRPVRSLDRHDLFVPRARTSMAQTRAFAIIGPSLWNQLLPSTRSTLLTVEPSASFRSLKTALFSLGLSHWKRF